MWNISTAFWIFAVIALIIGVAIMLLSAIEDNREDVHTADRALTTRRANLFLTLAIALVLAAIYFQNKEHMGGHMNTHMYL